MIRLRRTRASIPAKYRGAKLAAMLADLLAGWYEFKGDVPFNTKKARFQKWKDAKPALQKESAGKCAYCESLTEVVTYGDVEHFRPKDLYWWLAFSFDNYTFACQLCNQKFKKANFPVAGPRVKPPVKLPAKRPAAARLGTLAGKLCPDPAGDTDARLLAYFKKEQADLPHPYLDDPEPLFAWEADEVNREVRLVAVKGSARSARAVRAAEQFLGLNREELRRARFGTYFHVQTLCTVVQALPPESAAHGKALANLRSATAAGQPYAGMTRWFLRSWGVLQP